MNIVADGKVSDGTVELNGTHILFPILQSAHATRESDIGTGV